MAVGQGIRDVGLDRDAVARQRDGGRQQLRQREFSRASASPATVPGTPIAKAESRDFAGSALPLASRNVLSLTPCGAVSR
jgi:hypothetical protein